MNGRLMLLILVTGLFMRVWSVREVGDLPPIAQDQPTAVTWAPSNDSPDRGAAAIVVDLGEPTLFPDDQPAPRHTAAAWASFHHPVPLPEGIAPGKYRVVDNTGRVDVVEVTRQRSGAAANQPEYELYMKSAHDRQWYFIRLREADEPDATIESDEDAFFLQAPNSHERDQGAATFRNHKFDFTPYPDDEFEAVVEPTESSRNDLLR